MKLNIVKLVNGETSIDIWINKIRLDLLET